ncbi:MAG: ATP-binding protein [Eubacteriales bacterium]
MRNRAARPIFTTLRVKMLLAYLGIIALILAILNYYPLLIARDFIISTNQEDILADCNFIAQRASSFSEDNLQSSMDTLVSNMNLSRQYNRILVTDQNAVVLYDNQQQENIRGKKAIFSEIYTALGGQEVFLPTYTPDVFTFSAAAPLLADEEVVGCVYLTTTSYEEAQLLTSTQNQILLFTLILCALVMGLSFFFSVVLTGQIKVLGSGVRHMQEGDYQTKVPVTTDDELGQLAQAFNDLTIKLYETDEKRKQFVSDASHELKTPLASIKLLVDSINSSPDMDRALLAEFLEDISNEIDRLVRITEHLFILTRMDSDLVSPPVRIDAKAEIQRALRTLVPIAQSRGISVTYALEDDCYLMGSQEGFSHVVYNLIDNAIKYNTDFGYVTLRLFVRDELLYFVVKDNGIGISQEDQKHIFNRFYRVDKARSRETGGTGLGLSIVQANVQLLGGEITLDSELGKGSKFTVTLPACPPPQN